jgi:hypothetical protein
MAAILERLNEVVGVEATDKLVGAYGGRRLYVPILPRLARRTELLDLLGDRAQDLSREFGGDRILIPLRKAIGRGSLIPDEIKMAILAERAQLSIYDLSSKYRVSGRSVMRICKDFVPRPI